MTNKETATYLREWVKTAHGLGVGVTVNRVTCQFNL